MRLQIRAKSVLGRDLEELRSKRIAAENPPVQIVEQSVASDPPPHMNHDENLPVTINEERPQETTPMPTILKEEEGSVQNDPSKNIVHEEEMKEPMILSPPSTNDNKSQPIGLGINTTLPASTDAPATATAGGPDSSIDSLFDMSDSAANDKSAAFDFDMDFLIPDATTNTQSQDNNQTQNTELDLSTFGNNPQDFNMNDLQLSNEASSDNANINTTNTKGDSMDDLLNMTAGSYTNDNSNNNNNDNGNNNNKNKNNNMDIDLDLDNMVGAEESSFEDMFFGGDDDANVGEELGEMEHGQFDNAFFGIE